MFTRLSTSCLFAGISFALALSLLLGPAAAQDRDNGYSRLLKEAEKDMKPSEQTAERLIRYLQDDWFYNREAAVKELKLRGKKNHALMLDAWSKGELETSSRADTVLRHIANVEFKEFAKTVKPKMSAKLTNPRFWSGTNSFAGNIPDRSLDSSVEVVCDHKLERVYTPLFVKAGKTDTGEEIGSQIWDRSQSCGTSFSLFLQRPVRDFAEVKVTVVLKGELRFVEKLADDFKEQRWDVRKDVLWVSLGSLKDKPGWHVLEATDLFGRLGSGQVQLFGADGKASAATLHEGRGSYRRRWWIEVPEKTAPPARFSLRVESVPIPIECEQEVTVPHPLKK